MLTDSDEDDSKEVSALLSDDVILPDEDDIKNNVEKSSNNKKGVQFMITNRMKSILQDQLGYLRHEVNDMEPQIAAIVIEKSLVRPLKGMPDSWKRPVIVERNRFKGLSSSFHSLRQRSTSWMKRSLITTTKSLKRLLPVVIPITTTVVSATVIKIGISNGMFVTVFKVIKEISIKGIRAITRKDSKKNTKSKTNKSRFIFPFGKSQSQKSKVNLELLKRIQDQNPISKMKLRFDVWKNKVF